MVLTCMTNERDACQTFWENELDISSSSVSRSPRIMSTKKGISRPVIISTTGCWGRTH